jgi:hypothetical protein
MYEANDIKFESIQMDDSGFLCVKASGMINCSATEALDYTWNFTRSADNVLKVDDTITSYKIIEEKDNLRKFYQANKLPWPLYPRDLVAMSHKLNNDQSILMYSVPHEVIDTNCVRSDLTVSVHAFKDKGDKCKVIRIAHLNPNGSIPSAIVNMYTDKVAVMIKVLQEKFN